MSLRLPRSVPNSASAAHVRRRLSFSLVLVATLTVVACGRTSPTRPQASLVPRAPWLTVAVRRTVLHHGHAVTHRISGVSTDDSSLVESVRLAVNRLPLGKPGTPPACPAEVGDLAVWLMFGRQRQGATVASVKINPFECGLPTWITIVASKHGRWAVHDASAVDRLLHRILGARLAGLPR
jgi:hypothetical protein